MSRALILAKKLISCKSIDSNNKCQMILFKYLKKIGFICKIIKSEKIINLWCIKYGSGKKKSKTLAFSGHTDVVDPGPISKWTSHPFTPTIRNGKLYGRGAADMKTAIASFIIATEEFILNNPNHINSISLLITGDEEGSAINGTIKIVEFLKLNNEKIDYCIIGEPTSSIILGDTIKNGRRGSMHLEVIVNGIQGHAAYPHLVKNPIHLFAPAISKLISKKWDNGNKYFPPTTCQILSLNTDFLSKNVTPNYIKARINFRFSSIKSIENLQCKVNNILKIFKFNFDLKWDVSSLPFFTPPCKLSRILIKAIQDELYITPILSTSGGTSDGRFISQICKEVIEFGPPNESIHKINEYIEIKFINQLKNIYLKVLEKLEK